MPVAPCLTPTRSGLDAAAPHVLRHTQVLASANHNFTMTERRRFYLRYLGGLAYFEVLELGCMQHAQGVPLPLPVGCTCGGAGCALTRMLPAVPLAHALTLHTRAQISGPAVYSTYLQAAQRLGLSERASEYWWVQAARPPKHASQPRDQWGYEIS